MLADGELAHGAGAQGDAAQTQLVLAADRLHGVAHDVEHGLDHLLAIDQQVRNARVVIAHQSDAALGFSGRPDCTRVRALHARWSWPAKAACWSRACDRLGYAAGRPLR